LTYVVGIWLGLARRMLAAKP